jgi:hypothetical protein
MIEAGGDEYSAEDVEERVQPLHEVQGSWRSPREHSRQKIHVVFRLDKDPQH